MFHSAVANALDFRVAKKLRGHGFDSHMNVSINTIGYGMILNFFANTNFFATVLV